MSEDSPGAQEFKAKRHSNVEFVIAVTLGLLVLACFITQVRRSGSQVTPTEVFLFNLLQFFLTTGFAWFSTRALSRIEFEQSLKKFAISAYRRIDDIERMVDRLRREVRQMISETPKDEAANLRIVDAIIADTGQVVRSSISDWGDVIGEELLAVERLKRLEREKDLLNQDDASHRFSGAVNDPLKKIESAIARIESTLPAPLQLARDSNQERESRSVGRAMQWLEKERQRENGVSLTAVCGNIYPSERDPFTLEPGEVLMAGRLIGGGIDLKDRNGRAVARLLNGSKEPYDRFASALSLVYGDNLPFEFARVKREKLEEGGKITWIEVRLAAKPVRDRGGESGPER